MPNISLSIDQIPIAILVTDDNEQVVEFNNCAKRWLRLSASDVIGQPIDNLLECFATDVIPQANSSAHARDCDVSCTLLKGANQSLSHVQVKKSRLELFNYYYISAYEPSEQALDETRYKDTRFVLESLNEAFWEWELASDSIYYSSELMHLLGYKKESLQAPRSFWFKHVVNLNQNSPDIENHRRRVFEGKLPDYNYTFEVSTLDQRYLWLQVIGRVVYNSSGEPVRVFGGVRDVTETKSLIRQLKKQNSYLSLAERISNSGHWRYDVKAQKMFWSTELYHIFGTEPHQFDPSIEGELTFHLPEERSAIRQQLDESITHGLSYYNKSTIIQPNGQKAKIETIGEVELDEKGEVLALFGICRDVTKSETLFEKLKLLALVNYTIKVPIFFINEEDNVVYQDLSPQQGNGNKVLFNYINFSITEYIKLKKIARKKGQLKRSSISFDDFNSVFDLSVTYEGDEGIYIWIVENVTEKFRKEQQQIISNRLALLGNTFGNVSHDINNVLGVALGAIEMLELKFSQGEKDISGYIERVKNAIDKGKSVTERLLAFTKKPMVKVVEFDPLKDLIDNQYLFKQILINTINLEIELPDDVCTIHFPQGEFINILLNLVINSQDAIKEQGLSGTIKIVAKFNDNDRLEVHVLDSGVGIQSENLTKIFDPFYSSKSVNKGNGIGLANVYSTMYKHNGEIKVYGKSELGGAHFILEFKCKKLSESVSLSSRSGKKLSLHGKKILILDDETSIAEFVALFLENFGGQTFHVSNKEQLAQAVELAGPFDIFMTDMILPDLTGRQAAELVQHKYPDIKVLSMSGYLDNEDDTWAYPVLRKPFNSKELAEFFTNCYATKGQSIKL